MVDIWVVYKETEVRNKKALCCIRQNYAAIDILWILFLLASSDKTSLYFAFLFFDIKIEFSNSGFRPYSCIIANQLGLFLFKNSRYAFMQFIYRFFSFHYNLSILNSSLIFNELSYIFSCVEKEGIRTFISCIISK